MGCKNDGEKKPRHRQNETNNGEYITKKEHIERKEDGTIVKTVIEERVVVDTNSNKKQNMKQEKNKEVSPSQPNNNTDLNLNAFRKEALSVHNDYRSNHNADLNLNAFRNEALSVHNDYRSNHNAPPLKLNSKLNDIAQNYAEQLAKKDTMVHSKNKMDGQDLGENLFMCGGYMITGKDMTKAWYDEIYDYDFKKPDFKSGTGHFTQVVWVGSKEVGFGAAKSKSGNYYGVANYFPPGNYIGEFEENVLRKKN